MAQRVRTKCWAGEELESERLGNERTTRKHGKHAVGLGATEAFLDEMSVVAMRGVCSLGQDGRCPPSEMSAGRRGVRGLASK